LWWDGGASERHVKMPGSGFYLGALSVSSLNYLHGSKKGKRICNALQCMLNCGEIQFVLCGTSFSILDFLIVGKSAFVEEGSLESMLERLKLRQY
jgi:hypothetical protein